MNSAPSHYSDLLETLKTYFPSPVSNPIMDGYFVHSVSCFLDRVDALKSAAPVLGSKREADYAAHRTLVMPDDMASVESINAMLADYCRGMTVWSHPNAQANVIPPPTISSITAYIAAALYNPNIIWDEYSARFAEAEVEAVAMLASLVGYDPAEAGGVFTFGGTGTILYGVKLALEKLTGGQAMKRGVRQEYKIVASGASHYARLNVAGWLGLGSDNLITVPSTSRNDISLPDLEATLRGLYERDETVLAIILTLGTTDAFGIDDLAAVADLRERLVAEYRPPFPPYLHADAVIGWPWLVFQDYDFDANPLGFHDRTLRALRDTLERMRPLFLADSLGMDFHKTGYAPYVSSLFLTKRRADLALLSRDPAAMPYLYQFGHYRPGLFTLECSRSGAGALAALANLKLLGKQGYQTILGHSVEMAERLRERLEGVPCARVLNEDNLGPVTLFRFYPEGVDAATAYRRELADPAYRAELERHNLYNRRIFDWTHAQAMRGEGVLLSWTDAYRFAADGKTPIAALKSFVMSPWTDHEAMETVVRQTLEARQRIDLGIDNRV
ncbi:aspartate aminotransferase family protein [Thiocystis minor]|uniref:pyridoxal phosphate-dependent decarboxylase family protein n=1 Tax=Thiocystis minor TaxID=61597 RepID=UPI0019112BAF|nr:pyridoxal-dependent decarboxylase [Thiocystis minor]MBK5965078.1 aspartate aminotransferase family protein [Thiocystis minor]